MNYAFLNVIENKKNQDIAIAALLLSLLYFFQLVIFYGIGGRDDSYITYWSAYSLSEMGEIVNYNGDRIEQSSSLLHVLLLAAIHKTTGISIPALGILFSTGIGIIAALLAGRLAHDMGITFYKWVPFAVILVPYFSYWSSSGMETSLTALCILLLLTTTRTFLADTHSKTNFLCVLSGIALYVLVRPESGLVIIVFFFLLIALFIAAQWIAAFPQAREHNKKLYLLFATSAAVFLMVTAWRYFYFGQFFPQPVYAKADIVHLADRLQLGWRYLGYAFNLSTSLLILLTLANLFRISQKKSRPHHLAWIIGFVFLLSYLAFVAFSGGDWMEARRLIAPVMPLICVLAAACLSRKAPACALFSLFVFLSLFDALQLSKNESNGLPASLAMKYSYIAGQIKPDDARIYDYGFNSVDAFNYSHLRDMLTIPVLDALVSSLSKEKTTPVYIASRQMGMIPYYLASRHYQHVRFIDLRGLVTKDIPDCHFISDSKPKSASGILITTGYYLENQIQIDASCSLPRIDIVYDTGLISNSVAETAALLASNEYRLYYTQGSKTENLFAQYIGINNKYKNITP